MCTKIGKNEKIELGPLLESRQANLSVKQVCLPTSTCMHVVTWLDDGLYHQLLLMLLPEKIGRSMNIYDSGFPLDRYENSHCRISCFGVERSSLVLGLRLRIEEHH